mgnify:CR=1 FL=1
MQRDVQRQADALCSIYDKRFSPPWRCHSTIRCNTACLVTMLLPTFQLVEICLRNRIDNAIRKYYTLHDNGNDPYTWYEWLIPSTKTHSVIKDAKNRAMRDTKKTHLSHGDIISHISFGAWISITKELQKNGKRSMERNMQRYISSRYSFKTTQQ